MCTLAHVLEAAGLSTVAFPSIREVAERMHPPRALFCEFPLGRPLGKPGDAVFQRDVLVQGLALLAAEEPVLATYPEVVESDETPMACALPPRYDPDLPAAVDEAQGLRAAYDRALAERGFTSVGRVIDADGVPDALAVLQRWADGADSKQDPLPGSTMAVCHDIRAYYQEAGLELVTGPPPGSRSFEAWFHESTEAGRTLLAARRALSRRDDIPRGVWYYMAPGHR